MKSHRCPVTEDTENAPKGQSLVELALTLPVLVLILVGVLDLGRLYMGYVALTNAAREGARYAIDHPTDTTGIQNQAVAEINGTGLPHLTASNISVSSGGTDSGNPITVTVSYPFPLVTPFLFAGLQTVSINTSATMQIK